MDAYKIAIKLFVENDSFLTHNEFVPIFHSWIQQAAFPDHVLVDVADYGHVKDGPGTVLVAHEANFYAERIDGRLGLTYSRKQPVEGTFTDRLHQAISTALDAADKLQTDPRLEGRLSFKTEELVVILNDRLLAPNTAETFAQVQPALRAVLEEIYAGGSIVLEHHPDPRALFTIHVKITSAPQTLTAIRSRLPAASAPSR